MKLYRRSWHVEKAAFLPDGCQALRLTDTKAAPWCRGFIATPMEYTVQVGDTLTVLSTAPKSDGKSTVRYRFNDGPWLSSDDPAIPCKSAGHSAADMIAAGLGRRVRIGRGILP